MNALAPPMRMRAPRKVARLGATAAISAVAA